jgi:hypothetical protein
VKVYISARYSRKHEVADMARMLEQRGFEITSTWHKEDHAPDVQLVDVNPGRLKAYARRDLVEVRLCEVFLFLSESDQAYNRRGGRHVEFGYALGYRKGIAVIGPRENIFHHIPGVYHHKDLDEFIEEWNDGTVDKQL